VALFNAPNHICPGTCTNFNNISLNAVSYVWSFPGANPSTSVDVNPTNICYNSPGQYDVTLVATNAAGSDTITLANFITVFPYPPPQGILQNGDTLFANAGAVSYQWYHDGILIPGATVYFYVASEGGSYNVVATDANDCEVEAVIFDVVAGIHDANGSLLSGQLFIYPNPVYDKLTVGFKNIEDVQVSVYNVIGEKVYSDSESETNLDGNLEMDFNNFSPGIYCLEVKSAGKNYYIKFIKSSLPQGKR